LRFGLKFRFDLEEDREDIRRRPAELSAKIIGPFDFQDKVRRGWEEQIDKPYLVPERP
jgi:hypothetical protein